MLLLRVFGDGPKMAEAAASLSHLAGAHHVVHTDSGHDGRAMVTADLEAESADAVIDAVRRMGVPNEDVSLLRLEEIRAEGRPHVHTALLWADLLSQAGRNARPVARYLVLMSIAGIIAAYGVIYANQILIVGAMAVSPDLLPITAIGIGLIAGRVGLSARAALALGLGLAFTTLCAAALTKAVDLLDLLPDSFKLGAGAVSGLATVNSSTVVVALVAGVAGMLALETRARAAVGVAISVTTIPAAAYIGVAFGVGEVRKGFGALAVLGINVAMLVIGGTAALLLQRALARRSAERARASSA